MALSVEPFQMLTTIGENEKVFSHIRLDIRKAAKSLAEKAIKSPKLTVALLASLADAMGKENLGLLLEGLPKSALKTICKRLDRYNECFQKGAAEPDDIWLRKRILNLALNKESPASKPEKKAKASKPAAKKTRSSKASTGAKRKPAKLGKRTAVHAKRKN